jgi:hypothetical protein
MQLKGLQMSEIVSPIVIFITGKTQTFQSFYSLLSTFYSHQSLKGSSLSPHHGEKSSKTMN